MDFPIVSNPGSAVVAMAKQQSTSLNAVLLTGLLFVLSLVAFMAAFYFFDGPSVVSDLIGGNNPFATGERPASSSDVTSSALSLPDGMDDRYALQLWQEQVDSQYMIGRLVNGDIKSLSITDVETSSAEATISISARVADGTTVSGILGFRRFGDAWYIAYVSRRNDYRVMAESDELPDVSSIDVPLMNTILEQQGASQAVFKEYLAGGVYSIDLTGIRKGASTVSIDATMNENHGKGLARIVAIRRVHDGKTLWFLARFVKLGDAPLER